MTRGIRATGVSASSQRQIIEHVGGISGAFLPREDKGHRIVYDSHHRFSAVRNRQYVAEAYLFDPTRASDGNGDLAEASFQRWCTLCKMAATKASPDRMGWDYFVEVEPPVDPSTPLDRQPSLPKFLVQVKSSVKARKSVRVKLSAIKRLVDTDLPAFLTFIVINEFSEIVESRLLHIGERQIEFILSATRKEEARGRTDLHNVKVSLPLDDSEKLNIDSRNIPNSISNIINDNRYMRRKRRFREHCGYGVNSINAHIRFDSDVDDEKIIDFLIGVIPSLRVEKMEVQKSRFGIVVDKDIDRIEGAILTLGNDGGQDGIIVASSRAAGTRASLEARIRTPAIANLDLRRAKIRVHNSHVEMICNFEKESCAFKFHIDPDRKYSLNALIDAIRFGRVIVQPDCTIEVEVRDESLVVSKAFSLGEDHHYWSKTLEFAELLVSAAQKSGYRKVLETSLSELAQAVDENESAFVTLTKAGVEFTFGMEEPAPALFADHGIVFLPVAMEFQNLIYSAVVKLEAEIKLSDDRLHAKFVCESPTIVEELLVEKGRFEVAVLNARI